MSASMPGRRHGDTLVALALACLLGLVWTWRDWADLSRLRLPDTDDVVRLQQIRDWIAGQAFGDLTQHRLGPAPGTVMHWSRLPDLAPAALILLLTPLLGTAGATLAAVIVWPLALFAAALALVARVARALGAPGATAALVAALAYPATTVFLPGRIDHHGLQLVLLLLVVDALVRPGTAMRGAMAGLATAASVAIGLETAPLLAVAGAWIVGAWARRPDARLAGYAAALAGGLALAALVLGTDGWRYSACDAFTAQFWRAAQLAALAPFALAAATPWLATARHRGAAALAATLLAAAGAVWLSPACLHPYGALDPLLARVWLTQVAEAQPLLAAPPTQAIGYAGVMLAGLVATAVAGGREGVRWAPLLLLQLAALALTCAQLRGAYAGAILAAPALAAALARARTRGAAMLAATWLVSAGLLYPLAASALVPSASIAPAAPAQDCASPAVLARLAALPPGTLLAPVDAGAWALAATPHRILAAPYHRDTAGLRLAYRFFLADPAKAAAIARAARVDYVLWCDGGLGQGVAPSPRALATRLAAGSPPAWLRPLPVDGAALFRVAGTYP